MVYVPSYHEPFVFPSFRNPRSKSRKLWRAFYRNAFFSQPDDLEKMATFVSQETVNTFEAPHLRGMLFCKKIIIQNS